MKINANQPQIFQGLNRIIANIASIDRQISAEQGNDSIHSCDFPKMFIQINLKDSGTKYQAKYITQHFKKKENGTAHGHA